MAEPGAKIVNGIVIGMDAKHRYHQHECEDSIDDGGYQAEVAKRMGGTRAPALAVQPPSDSRWTAYHDPLEKGAPPVEKTKVSRAVDLLKGMGGTEQPRGAVAKPRSDPKWMADRRNHQEHHDEIGHALDLSWEIQAQAAAVKPDRWNAYHDDVETGVGKCKVTRAMDVLNKVGSEKPSRGDAVDSSWSLTALPLPPPVKPLIHSKWPRRVKVIGAATLVVVIGLLAIYLLVMSGDEHCSPTVIVDGTSLATRGPPTGVNPCLNKKPTEGFENFECFQNNVVVALEQAGSNVTKGYKGELHTDAVPITDPFFKQGLCPVNVHWHIGAEHFSLHEYDDHGHGPSGHRRLYGSAHEARMGFQCSHYTEADPKFTKPYEWKHCLEMEVGQTYEVHWPHSRAGKCGTVNQYQTPFYDGVFCEDSVVAGMLEPNDARTTFNSIGVQAQVYVVVNDERYYYPDLFHGMIIDGDYGADMAFYTGSTTGTSRDNEICSAYAPITWQVDRKCHLISASSFDKLCADMKAQRDDMSEDMYPHGSRELVADELAADNHV